MASVDFGFDVADPQSYLTAAMNVGLFAVGTGSPEEQIVAAAIVIVVGISSSFITLGATVFVVFLGLFFLAVGFARLGWQALAG